MKLKIITATEELLNTDGVNQVNLPGAVGEIGILPGHINLISPLSVGKLDYKKEGETHSIVVNGGFVQVFEDDILVLANEAQPTEKLILEEIDRAIKLAEEKIASTDIEASELIQLEKQLRYEKLKRLTIEER